MNRTSQTLANDILARTAENGGCTFEARTLIPFEPTSGYAVGLGGIVLAADAVNVDSLVWAVRMAAGEFNTSFAGTWLDDDGLVHIDGVTYIGAAFRHLAEAVGREHGQLAIYDFATGESITL